MGDPYSGYDAATIAGELRELIGLLNAEDAVQGSNRAQTIHARMVKLTTMPEPAFIGHQPKLPAAQMGLDAGKCKAVLSAMDETQFMIRKEQFKQAVDTCEQALAEWERGEG
jgi:hypothetical protein